MLNDFEGVLWVITGMSYYKSEIEQSEYNLELAKQELADAGYPNGFSTKIYANEMSNTIPGFVLAVGLMYLLSVKYKLLPTSGFTFPWVDFGKHFQQIIMPMFCLSLGGMAGVCRQTRSSMLEAIRQDYVRTARSKGLEENTIISKHVLKNGLIPIVTLIGGRLAMMIGGSVFIENVFSIPGMGSLMVNSVNNFDIPVIQACVLLTSVIISLAYFITDMLYLAVDPRITLK